MLNRNNNFSKDNTLRIACITGNMDVVKTILLNPRTLYSLLYMIMLYWNLHLHQEIQI
jgi:hypothetical protein